MDANLIRMDEANVELPNPLYPEDVPQPSGFAAYMDETAKTNPAPWLTQYRRDLFSRLSPWVAAEATRKGARTFLQGAVGALVLTGTGTIDAWQGAAVAGIGGVVALIQNSLGK